MIAGCPHCHSEISCLRSDGNSSCVGCGLVFDIFENPEHDPVSNPAHYTAGGISPLDLIEAQGMGRDFCLGNAIKYIARAGKKDGSPELEDLKKAQWYLSRYINKLEEI